MRQIVECRGRSLSSATASPGGGCCTRRCSWWTISTFLARARAPAVRLGRRMFAQGPRGHLRGYLPACARARVYARARGLCHCASWVFRGGKPTSTRASSVRTRSRRTSRCRLRRRRRLASSRHEVSEPIGRSVAGHTVLPKFATTLRLVRRVVSWQETSIALCEWLSQVICSNMHRHGGAPTTKGNTTGWLRNREVSSYRSASCR